MSAEQNLDLIKRIYADFVTKGSTALLMESLTDDVVYKVTVPPGTPFSGEFRGKEGVARYFLDLPTVVKHLQINVGDYMATDDKVVVLGDETVIVLKSGETNFSEWAVVWSFRGDKVYSVLIIEDLSIIRDAYRAESAAA